MKTDTDRKLYADKIASAQLDIGMTDADLELACESQANSRAQWVYWTSEMYSFGKAFRTWVGYPKVLPLFVEADHGVGLLSQLFPRDFESTAKIYFTWHPLKEQRYKEYVGKKVVRIAHPWVPYRRMRGIARSKSPRGTIVFYTHSTPTVEWVGHDTEEYFKQLRELPSKYHPIVLCLHMHDIKAGTHKKLRQYGFPIVTEGSIYSADFVDRFYSMVRSYSYATSQGWGSHVAYCIELGIPYFFLGERPKLFNISNPCLPDGEAPQYWDEFHEVYAKEAEALFRLPVDSVTTEQRSFAESLLGLDSQVTRRRILWLLWREFFRSWKQWYLIPKLALVAYLERRGLLDRVKQLRQRPNKRV